MLADLGAQALGAISYGIYPTASAAEVEYQLRDGGAVGLRRRGPGVRRPDPAVRRPAAGAALDRGRSTRRRCSATTIPSSATTARLLERGAARRRGARGAGGARRAASRRGDPAFIVYTSGTTGHPKGALVAHGRHLAGAYNLVEHYPMLAEPQRTVVYLPLCHILGRDVAMTLPLLSRAGAALRRGRRGPRRRRCSRWRRPCSSPCRGTCRSSPSQALVARAATRAALKRARLRRARCASAARHARGALGGRARHARSRSAYALARARRLPPDAQQARVRRSSSWSSAAARRCRRRRWRCGRSGA